MYVWPFFKITHERVKKKQSKFNTFMIEHLTFQRPFSKTLYSVSFSVEFSHEFRNMTLTTINAKTLSEEHLAKIVNSF